MKQPQCPQCQRLIPSEDVNVVSDVAYCRSCNAGHLLSELIDPVLDAYIDLNRPIEGTWHRLTFQGVELGVSHRSAVAALGTLAAAVFWNGIVSVFVVIALSGTVNVMGKTAPEWFPAPEMNDQTMGVGMVIFMWLFLTPFILVGLFLIFSVFLALGGKTTVRIERDQGALFTGIGPIGYKRRFSVREVEKVSIDRSERNDAESVQILLKSGKDLKFGSILSNEKRVFIGSALRKILADTA